MILVFLFVCLVVLIVELLFVSTKIRVQIMNFKFNSKTEEHVNKDYKFIIKFYILGFVPFCKLNITNEKLEKLKDRLKNLDFSMLDSDHKFDRRLVKAFKNLDFDIENLNLNVNLGTENSFITALIVPAIATVISMFLRNKIKSSDHQIFIINPVFMNQNLVNIYFSGIFEFKMRNIINTIFILIKKEKKGEDKYVRSSYRRPYGYSYE